MWVKGDLKDQLGLSHRNVRKGKNVSDNNLEAAPMFANVHERSLSDFHNYEPAMVDSPPSVSSLTEPTTCLDTPPMSDILELPPRVQYTQPSTSDLHLPPSTNAATPSPQPSYYSATDIPIPSPQPSPIYQLPSGELTSTPPSRRPSIATSRATSIRGRSSIPTSQLPSHSPSDVSQSIPPTKIYGKNASPVYAGEYEMQTYDEQVHGSGQARHASFASSDDFWTDEEGGGGGPDYAYQHTQMLRTHTPPPQTDLFDVQSPRSHMASQDDEDDRSTVVADSRRGSLSTTWEGGRAL